MAEIQSWQRQSFAKNASTGPSTMNSKIAGNNAGGLHAKIGRPTVKNYADGGAVTDDFTGYDQAVAANSDNGEWARGENYGDGTTGDERVAQARKPVDTTGAIEKMAAMTAGDTGSEVKIDGVGGGKKSFKDAFAENRKAGNATFEWNGKKFSTEIATGKQAPRMAQKEFTKPTKTFSEDVAERKAANSVEKKVAAAMTRDENYGNEGRRSVMARTPSGRGVIDTSNIDSKTLLPKR